MATAMPGRAAGRPHFSSGPCAKRPGWSLQALTDAVSRPLAPREDRQGASSSARIDLTREVLEVPADYPHRHRAGLRHRRRRDGAVVAARRAAGRPCWPGRASAKAGSPTSSSSSSSRTRRVLKAPYGELPDLAKVDCDDATSSSPGTAPPRACACRTRDWIAADREGLTICDATSAAFAQRARLGQSSMS